MKTETENRVRRFIQLPTTLLLLALVAGFASVGQAEDLSAMVITTPRPADCETESTFEDEMAAKAELAVWMTRVSVATDLGAKLHSQRRAFRIAAKDTGNRG